jgi:uncharacterized coiled-coil protein SlyX
MTRTPDSNTEKLNELFDRLADLKRRKEALESLTSTIMREATLKDVNNKLAEVQAEIDKLRDADL